MTHPESPVDPAVLVDPAPAADTTVIRPSPPIQTNRPSWLALRARPDQAKRAREFAETAVFGLPFDPYEIALITSEIVTNAIVTADRLRPWPPDVYPLAVEILATFRYVRISVTDPDHRPIAVSAVGGLEAEHGRGLHIIDQHAAGRWVTYAEHHKTVHVVIAAPGVELTTAELAAMGMPA